MYEAVYQYNLAILKLNFFPPQIFDRFSKLLMLGATTFLDDILTVIPCINMSTWSHAMCVLQLYGAQHKLCEGNGYMTVYWKETSDIINYTFTMWLLYKTTQEVYTDRHEICHWTHTCTGCLLHTSFNLSIVLLIPHLPGDILKFLLQTGESHPQS